MIYRVLAYNICRIWKKIYFLLSKFPFTERQKLNKYFYTQLTFSQFAAVHDKSESSHCSSSQNPFAYRNIYLRAVLLLLLTLAIRTSVVRGRTQRFSVNGPPSKARSTARIRASQWSRPNCSQTKVRWNSPSFHFEAPRLAGLNGANPWLVGLTVMMTSLHWLSRACRTTWLPEDRPLSLSLFIPLSDSLSTLLPVALLAWVKTIFRICRREDSSTNLFFLYW